MSILKCIIIVIIALMPVYHYNSWIMTAPFLCLQNMARDAGLMEKLGEPGQYTLFAPTNEAFDKLGSDVLERIMSDKDVLKGKSKGEGLQYHLPLSGVTSESLEFKIENKGQTSSSSI